jgi:hypothetical protein
MLKLIKIQPYHEIIKQEIRGFSMLRDVETFPECFGESGVLMRTKRKATGAALTAKRSARDRTISKINNYLDK